MPCRSNIADTSMLPDLPASMCQGKQRVDISPPPPSNCKRFYDCEQQTYIGSQRRFPLFFLSSFLFFSLPNTLELGSPTSCHVKSSGCNPFSTRGTNPVLRQLSHFRTRKRRLPRRSPVRIPATHKGVSTRNTYTPHTPPPTPPPQPDY